MSVDVKYEVSAVAKGGRDGQARTEDGQFDVKLSTPKALGGSGGDGNNPEQLFAAGYAACFLGAMKAVSKDVGVKVTDDTTVHSTVGIGPRDAGGFGLTVALRVNMPGTDRGDAKKLIDEAHQICPYSNATRNNIDVQLEVA